MRKAIAIGLCACALAACDAANTVLEGFRRARAVEDALEKSQGTRPTVGFNWSNGRLLRVSVEFPRLPPGQSFDATAAATRTAVADNFAQTPDKLILGFVIETSK
jgi:hypothetical protein